MVRGYHGRPELDAERFIPDPFAADAARADAWLYRSGDMVRLNASGQLDFLGRSDHQVKVRGFRIEPGEIEAMLAQVAGVKHSVVVVREDLPGVRRLVAYVVAATEAWQPSALRAHLQKNLPDYMVPSAFVRLDALPRLPNDKLDRRALPAPDFDGPGRATEFVPARSATETALAGLWIEVLRVPRVGVRDDFFELGGDSLQATQVVSRIRERLHVELGVRDLFECPTIVALAERLAQSGGALLPPPPVRSAREGGLPLSFAQQRLWFIVQLEPGGVAYNMP